MNACRVVAVVGFGLCALGCRPTPCVATAHAAVALDVACGAAGLEKSDPALLVQCATAYATVKGALLAGKCAPELVRP